MNAALRWMPISLTSHPSPSHSINRPHASPLILCFTASTHFDTHPIDVCAKQCDAMRCDAMQNIENIAFENQQSNESELQQLNTAFRAVFIRVSIIDIN